MTPLLNETDLQRQIDANLLLCHETLAALPFSGGQKPNIGGLNGWVFEKTLESLLRRELAHAGVSLPFANQVKIVGRAKTDLVIGKVAFEIKSAGFFSKDSGQTYTFYRKHLNDKGMDYLYVSRYLESNKNYRKGAVFAFGEENIFWMDQEGSWGRLLHRLLALNGVT